MTALGGLDGFVVEEFDAPNASDEDHRAGYDLTTVIQEELRPEDPRQPFEAAMKEMRLTHEWSKPLRLNVWNADRTRLVGAALLSRDYVESNRHLASVSAQVHPDFRRLGIGTALLRLLVEAAKEDGRTVLVAGTSGTSPGMEFLPARGFEAKQVGRMSRVYTKAIDRPLMEQWVADAKAGAADYELLAIDDRMPDDVVETWLALENVMNTAPRDDLEVEDFIPNVDRFRTYEAEMLELGYQLWRVIAVHKATGQWAGYSELVFSPHHPEVVEQWGTAVDPVHRGHGIGRWVKAANILRLLDERPEAERVETWNAKSNGPMLDINIAMGFEVARWSTTFQASIETIEATL